MLQRELVPPPRSGSPPLLHVSEEFWKEEEEEMEEHQYSREFPPRLRCIGVLPPRRRDVLRLVATPTTETGLFPGQEESGPCPEDRRRATPARVQAHVLRRGKAASLREQRLCSKKRPFRAPNKPRDRHETTGSFRASAVPRDRHETISLTVEADPLSKKRSLRKYQWLKQVGPDSCSTVCVSHSGEASPAATRQQPDSEETARSSGDTSCST